MNKRITSILLTCGLTLQGCGLDKVEVPTGLTGPSALGIDLRVVAIPDILVADGIQTAVVQAVVQDQNGQRVSGKGVVFTILDESARTAEIGQLIAPAAHGGTDTHRQIAAADPGKGVAQMAYGPGKIPGHAGSAEQAGQKTGE